MARDIFGKNQESSNTDMVTADQMTLILQDKEGLQVLLLNR